MYRTYGYGENFNRRFSAKTGPHSVTRQNPIWRTSAKRRGTSAMSDRIPDENQQLISWTTAEISIPGMRQLKNPNYNKIGKLFWLLAILASASLCIQQVSRRCYRYIHSPIGFHVSLDRESHVDFPAFTICTSNATVFNQNTSNLYYTKYNFSRLMDRENINVTYLWHVLSVSEDAIQLNDTCPKEICFYKQTIATYRGDCVTIHSPKNVFHVGAKTGFTVIIKKRQEIAPRVEELITVYCHENNWTPVYFSYYDTSIYHSHITTISIMRRRFTYLNTKSDPCTTTIGTADCWRECLERDMRTLANTTHCRIPSMIPDDTELCTDSSDVNKTHFAIIKRFKDREGKQCPCPRRCSEVLFNLIQDVVKPDEDGNTVLNVYIPDDSVDSLIEEYDYSFVQLLCDLGGTLGLFLGFCALTLLELIEVFIAYVKMKFFGGEKVGRLVRRVR